MPTNVERAIKRLRDQGYRVANAPSAAVSPDGFILSRTVGGGLASDDDIIRISEGLDHLPTGPDFVIGQAVQILSALLPANIPAGAVATVLEVWPGRVVICKGMHKVNIDQSAIRAFPLPEARTRQS